MPNRRLAALRVMVVADSKQQRFAFREALASWGCQLIDCVEPSRLALSHLISEVDVWLVDSQQDYVLLQEIEWYHKTQVEARQLRLGEPIGNVRPNVVLMGFLPAPYQNECQRYAKWQRQLKRKLLRLLPNAAGSNVSQPRRTRGDAWQYVVVLAASMGGPVAIKEFLDNLPSGLPITLLIAQHFDQEKLNGLPRVLTRHNDWPCEVITTNQSLQMGHSVIVPVDRAVVCDSSGRVMLQNDGWQGEYSPSIDQLLTNASEVFGEQLIGILFSGMGDDGSQAAKIMQYNGSRLWVQSLDSSICDSQPKHIIETGGVELVASPKALAEALVQLCQTTLADDKKMPNWY